MRAPITRELPGTLALHKRKNRLCNEVGTFLTQYRRKAHPTHDPNDRNYDRDTEKRIKAMHPAELSELISGEGAEVNDEEEKAWFSGRNPVGVRFSLNQGVQLKLRGREERGAVVSLLRVHPTPQYLIELSDGGEIEAFQNQLSPRKI